MNAPANALQVDGQGYIITADGCKLARVERGIIYLWDKRAHREVPLTLDDLRAMWTATRTQTAD